MTTPKLVVILGDQLSSEISALRQADRGADRILMAEVDGEASYVKHHKKKIIFVFSAMRHFAAQLRNNGWTVDYVKIDDPGNSGSITGEVERVVSTFSVKKIVVTHPGEWRLKREMSRWREQFGIPVDIVDDDRFLTSPNEFATWADGRKQLRLEHFYREMRRKTGLLMDGSQPLGGAWNYDSLNRKPARPGTSFPGPAKFAPDVTTSEVIKTVETRFSDHFGNSNPFWFAVTSEQAEAAFTHFLDKSAAGFGDYQDAMLAGEHFLFHSVLAVYLNAGLLDPLHLCREVERRYHDGQIPINAAEGFVRQIIGWREYVRGIYWLKMPDYKELNYLAGERSLPDFYWTGETDMNCMREAITQTKQEAYAHHIQRLMVTGNFALLAGIDPDQVHEWYLAVYADAYEWVELPNTLGMSQFADGGLLGSKPYAASGNYINKMSDYCKNCTYDVKDKTGSSACPFNALYWDFMARNRDRLDANPRLFQIYRSWDRMKEERQSAYRDRAGEFLGSL
ncbi:MAG: cryptochrome/photolyase family protein [Rhizobiaceae bacterium]